MVQFKSYKQKCASLLNEPTVIQKGAPLQIIEVYISTKVGIGALGFCRCGVKETVSCGSGNKEGLHEDAVVGGFWAL